MGASAVRIVNGPEVVAAPAVVRNLPLVLVRPVTAVATRRTPPMPMQDERPAAGPGLRGRIVDILV